MDGLRAKISARLDGGLIRLTVAWVNVVDNRIEGEPVLVEEFNVSPDRPGVAYVSRAVFTEGEAAAGTFWLDEKGARHFYIQAEAGAIGLIGQECR